METRSRVYLNVKLQYDMINTPFGSMVEILSLGGLILSTYSSEYLNNMTRFTVRLVFSKLRHLTYASRDVMNRRYHISVVSHAHV